MLFRSIACNESVLGQATRLERPGRLLAIKYEDLITNPSKTLKDIAEFVMIPFERALQYHDKPLPVVSALTHPAPDKWLRQNRDAIDRILPMIRPTMEKMGYSV